MNNKILVSIIVIVLIIASFFGGYTYAQSKATASRSTFAASGFNRGTNGRGGLAGSALNGQIISKDATSITLEMRDGTGSKIVFISPTTLVMKFATGTIDDLTIGKQVTAMGSKNSDGSETAQSIQIRPASTTPARQ